MKRLLRSAVLVSLAVLLAAAPAAAAPVDQADGLDHFERDVYVIVGSTLRNPTVDTDPAAPLFNVAGVNLGVTWGQFSGASATSTARARGGSKTKTTEFNVAFTGLVPGGLYTIFWGTLGPDSEQPLCPGVERTLPLDSLDPAQPIAPNAFVAGADGTARFAGRAPGDLFKAQQVWLSVVYRPLNEATYPFPNRGELLTQGESCRSSFGDDAMRQLLVLQKW